MEDGNEDVFVLTTTQEPPILHFAVWDPTGERLAYSDGHSIHVVEVETGATHRLALPEHMRWVRVHDWSPDGRQMAFVTGTLIPELWMLHHPLDDGARTATR